MRARWGLLTILGIAICLGFAGAGFGQASVGVAHLNGTVHDESGGTVVKAAVTVREMDTNLSYTGATNGDGYYSFPSLPPGRYEIKVAFSGFSNYTQQGVILSVGQYATVDVGLKIATKGEEVTVVTNDAPPIETTRTEISQVIDTKQIGSLPISSRLFTDFALLTPGVSLGRTSLQSTVTEFEVTKVSFGGQRDLSNIVTVDGADTINTVTGAQRATPPQEAVSEFRVVNNSFGSEYGRALGGIVNIVTKSGSNDFHGSLYGYLQNQATDARSVLTSSQFDQLRQGQFGATIGGPIKKDKTFFFANYEGQRKAQSPSYPTDLISNITEINAAKKILGLEAENLGVLKTYDNDNGIVKLDHQINDKNRMSIRYNIQDLRDLNVLVGNTLDGGGIGAPSSGHNEYVRDQSLAGTLSTQVTPNLVNSFLYQYARRHYDFPGVTGQPNLDLSNDLLFGHNFGVFDYIGETRNQFSDTLATVKGSHTISFGFDTNFIRNKVTWPGFTPMRIVLPGLNCLATFTNFVFDQKGGIGNPIPQFPAGPCPLPPTDNGTPIIFWGAGIGNQPNSASPFISPPIPTNWLNAFLPSLTSDFNVHLDHTYTGFFFQDQWRATPKLTVNYGLRWDFETGFENVINRDYRNWAPRAGIAYALTPHTVIRAGGGIFFDRYNLSFIFVTYPQRPVVLQGVNLPGIKFGSQNNGWSLNQEPTVFIPGPGFIHNAAADAFTLLETGQVPPTNITGPNSLVGDGSNDHNSRTPYSDQASLEIDHEFGHGLTVSVGYLMVQAHKLVRPENLNVACPVGATPTVSSGNFITNCTGGVKLPDGKPVYNGPEFLDAGLLYYLDDSGNSIYHGLAVTATQRLGSYLRFNANYTYSKALDDGTFTTFVSTPQSTYERPTERANSNNDVRNRFIANFTANTPAHSFARNFELSGIVTVQSGRPFTDFVGFDANNDTNPVTDRVGLSARNTYIGDSLEVVDLRVSRFFKFKEHMRLDLSVDAFNAFNRANIDEVTSVYGAPDFCGAVPRHYKDAASIAIETGQVACPAGGPPFPNGGFGGPRTTFNPRQMQFGAKFSF
jgi:outer membrane receptor protein involved in Fe transport